MDDFDKKNLDRELREVESKIDELHRQSSSVLRDAENEYHRQVDRLKERTMSLRKKMESVAGQDSEMWDSVKSSFHRVLEDVKDKYNEIKKKI